MLKANKHCQVGMHVPHTAPPRPTPLHPTPPPPIPDCGVKWKGVGWSGACSKHVFCCYRIPAVADAVQCEITIIVWHILN